MVDDKKMVNIKGEKIFKGDDWNFFEYLRKSLNMPTNTVSRDLLVDNPLKFWGHFGERINDIKEANITCAYELLIANLQIYKPREFFMITENDHGFESHLGIKD